MLLYEDSDVRTSRFIVPQNVHVIPTWGLLKGMERRGLIASADEIWKAINDAGRFPPKERDESPAETPQGPTTW